MKINGNLEVLGVTKTKIKEITDYEFDGEDYGLLFLDGEELKLNNGTETITLSTTEFKTKFLSSNGNWLFPDFSFNSLAFNQLENISGLNANSNLLDAISQIDAAIPKSFSASYSSSTVHLVEHGLASDIAHVTVKNTSNGDKIPDSDMTVRFTDSNNITITLNTSLPIKVLVTAV